MSGVPHEVLSDHLQDRLHGRRLVSAVFMTFQLDPGFFEQEILPVLLDVPLSHAVPVRLLQLEEVLSGLSGRIAVFYDVNGLLPSDSGPARLDVLRIPVRHPTGLFHAKNVFILVESAEPDAEGERVRSLLMATLSANLTRTGWWENVEACHVEEIAEGEHSSLRADVASLLNHLRRQLPERTTDAALREMLRFLRGTRQRRKRSWNKFLHSRLYVGPESVPEFLAAAGGRELQGCYLEVISPFLDNAPHCKPLEDLIERFAPRETRVYLPRNAAGEALVARSLYETVCAKENVHWGRLPKDFMKLGRAEDAGERYVHAKVYRFFTLKPARERIFLGSVNLTHSAHQKGGNFESAVLVDTDVAHRPDWWLDLVEREPREFRHEGSSEDTATGSGSPLSLRYWWSTGRAEAFWDRREPSPRLRLEAQGVLLGELPELPPRVWRDLPPELVTSLAHALETTSFVSVAGHGREPALVLVLEEEMSHKRSLLMTLSAADILEYWALLSPEQRTAFLESRAPEVALLGPGADLVARPACLERHDTMFDRFAGYFHAFGCLERAVRKQLEADNQPAAVYRLFGRKYDSLGTLLERVLTGEDVRDEVDRYVICLCARQLRHELARSFPDFWARHAGDAKELDAALDRAGEVRHRLLEHDAVSMAPFLDWFDRWFLKRAERVEEPA
jgi:hypothetical protein